MEMKPLTANDLVIGGKYMVYGDICEYLYKSGVAYVFSKLDCRKTICLESLSGVIQITTADEPNQTTMNYTEQPFNLETALKHPEWVRTRDGREIDFIKEYPERGRIWSIVIVLKDGTSYSVSKDGFNHCQANENPKDLILRVPCVTKYTFLYSDWEYSLNDTPTPSDSYPSGKTIIAVAPVKISAIC